MTAASSKTITTLKKYVEFLRSKAENGLLKYSYYGDRVAIEKCPGSLVSTFYYYYDTKVLADMARLINKTAEAQSMTNLPATLRLLLTASFLTRKLVVTARPRRPTRPLFIGLATDKERGPAWSELFNDLVYEHDSHLTTGIIGTKYILDVLTSTATPTWPTIS